MQFKMNGKKVAALIIAIILIDQLLKFYIKLNFFLGEEHQVIGGVGSAVAECLAKTVPTHIEFVGVENKFGQSGTPNELIVHYGMGEEHIRDAVAKVLKRKG